MPTVQNVEDDKSSSAATPGERPVPPRALVPPDDEEDDEDLDETLAERLWGLTEMFPVSIRNGTAKIANFSQSSLSWLWEKGRNGVWIVASSATVLALPVMFEMERAQMEEQQLQQQRQLLLGPNAAVSGSSSSGLMPGGMPPLPQVAPPPQR